MNSGVCRLLLLDTHALRPRFEALPLLRACGREGIAAFNAVAALKAWVQGGGDEGRRGGPQTAGGVGGGQGQAGHRCPDLPPALVQTGLDLIDFPTLVWFETEFSVFHSTQNSTVLMGG